jgi:hypothetical protein
MLCCSLGVHHCFRGMYCLHLQGSSKMATHPRVTYRLHLQGQRISQARSLLSLLPASAWILAWLTLRPSWQREYVPWKCHVLSKLHDIKTQNVAYSLLRCDAMQSGRWVLTFQRNQLPSSVIYNCMASQKTIILTLAVMRTSSLIFSLRYNQTYIKVKWMYRSTFSWYQHLLEVSGQLHAPAALPRGRNPQYPLDLRLGGPQSRSGRYGEEKILDPTGTRTPTPRSSSS